MKRILVLFFTAVLSTFPSQAAFSPLAVSIVKPVQFPTDDFTVTGARFSLLWGEHRDIYGLDFGVLGNVTTQDFTGLALSGLFNNTRGNTRIIGFQAAALVNANTNKTQVYGLQLAALNYNSAETTVVGLQAALINLSEFSTVNGVQVGIYNKAKTVRGLQLGLVNSATDLRGIQIGLINFHHNGFFIASPIINVGF
jgi:hypothetical protein